MSAAAELRPVLSEVTNLRTVQAFTYSSEFDLLVACCADSSTHGNADRICQILSGPLDWEGMLGLVDHHRVVPRVYSQLSACSHLVPAQPLDALRLRYQDNARKTLWFTGELVRIVSHLESAGIKALPYKGPVLSETLYGEVTQRQFGDLDVLILPADVAKAKAALLDLGYKPRIELASRAERAYIETAYVETGYEYSFSAAYGSNLLELQWQVVPRFYSIDFDVADFFERADEIIVGGRPMRTLCAHDLLLVLCVHAAKHVWVQLSWLCDIAQLAKSRQLDWNAIQDDAKRLGIERIVSLNLLLAHKLLGSALPPAIQKRLGEYPSTTVLADEILRVIERSVHYHTESIPYFRLMMRLRERWQDRARFLWRLAFTPSVSEWSAVRLPKRLQPLYRVVRLSRLAKRLASAG
ncbi:MAG TPA: nucleotidyltransferase family protein [Terriglobales bacterium]|nr:nucleotidyltransferase family protein [Terriglobales bacterium]